MRYVKHNEAQSTWFAGGPKNHRNLERRCSLSRSRYLNLDCDSCRSMRRAATRERDLAADVVMPFIELHGDLEPPRLGTSHIRPEIRPRREVIHSVVFGVALGLPMERFGRRLERVLHMPDRGLFQQIVQEQAAPGIRPGHRTVDDGPLIGTQGNLLCLRSVDVRELSQWNIWIAHGTRLYHTLLGSVNSHIALLKNSSPMLRTRR